MRCLKRPDQFKTTALGSCLSPEQETADMLLQREDVIQKGAWQSMPTVLIRYHGLCALGPSARATW